MRVILTKILVTLLMVFIGIPVLIIGGGWRGLREEYPFALDDLWRRDFDFIHSADWMQWLAGK